jgi:hypothetical protein
MRTRLETAEYILLRKSFESGEEFDVHRASSFLGITVRNARMYLNLLHSSKDICIVEYKKHNRGPALPVYAKREQGWKDIPYPPRIPGCERIAIARQRKRLEKRI